MNNNPDEGRREFVEQVRDFDESEKPKSSIWLLLAPMILLVAALVFIGIDFFGNNLFVEIPPGDNYIVIEESDGNLKVDTNVDREGYFKTHVFALNKLVHIWHPLDGLEYEVEVVFQDGTKAEIKGNLEYSISNDPIQLKLLHEKYGSQWNFGEEEVEKFVSEVMARSARFVTAQESWDNESSNFTDYLLDQLEEGAYAFDRVEASPFGDLRTPISLGEDLTGQVSVRRDQDGMFVHENHSLKSWGVNIESFLVTNIIYEDTSK